jgi:hypothetical protein
VAWFLVVLAEVVVRKECTAMMVEIALSDGVGLDDVSLLLLDVSLPSLVGCYMVLVGLIVGHFHEPLEQPGTGPLECSQLYVLTGFAGLDNLADSLDCSLDCSLAAVDSLDGPLVAVD